MGSWSFRLDADRIAWLVCDTPNVTTNVLSATVLRELAQALDSISAQQPIALVLQSGKPNGFIAGADIKEFQAIRSPEQGYELVRAGQAVIAQLAALPFPSAAALHGFALGGGLELALACTYRVAADTPALSLGLPEVLLGIHPGFGGTVRSVRLLGIREALQMMLRGKPLRGTRALQLGLIDALVPAEELESRAKSMLLKAPRRRRAPLLDRLLNLAVLRPFIAKRSLAALRASVREEHYPAPFAILELWRNYAATGERAYVAEAQSISRLMCTSTARNLVRVFLLQDRPKAMGGASVAEFRHLHVVGAGVMGGDIAAWAAYRGMTVTLQDRSEDLIRPAMQRAKAFFDQRLKDPASATAALERLTMDVKGNGVADADIVIEAIFENVEAKRALYAALEPNLKPLAVLATNTSSIEIETLCQNLKDPARLIGIHFFNPVAQLPLVEIVNGLSTRASVTADALRFTRHLDKLPLPCRSSPGFVVNRILTPYINEALFALESGVPAALIDAVAVRFGMPMGPIELTDVVGLDVSLHVGRVLADAMSRQVPAALITRVEQKKLGRKSGEGFYAWRDGKAVKASVALDDAPADLEDRLILSMLNEAVACLRAGVIADADLLDAGVIFATGFAPFRGGPLQYAKDRGIAAVTARLTDFATRYGERFRPDSGWEQLQPHGS